MLIMNNQFPIQLASNVAPNIFPNNRPSNFKTPLVEEIHLSNGKWEVAVKDLMHPSHVSTTSAADRIDFHTYGRHTSSGFRLELDGESYIPYYQQTYILPNANKKNLIQSVLNELKRLPMWKIVQFEYNEEKDKFILHNYRNVLVCMTKEFQNFMGFLNSSYGAGSHWTTQSFTHSSKSLIKQMNVYFKLYDLDVMAEETYQTVKSSQQYEIHFGEVTPVAEAHKAPVDYTVALDVIKESNDNCKGGSFHLKLTRCAIALHYTPCLFTIFRLEQEFADLLAVNVYHVLPNYERQLLIPFKVDLRRIMKFYREKRRYPIFHLYKMKTLSPKVITSKADDIMELTAKESFKWPQEFLPILNAKSKAFGYTFTFLKDKARFGLEVYGEHCLRISESLQAILGFISSEEDKKTFYKGQYLATHSPYLTRGINNLFLYTNIVDPMFVGDTKAPLLLACAFKRNVEHDMVHQQFLNPTYVPINRSTINQIDIEIYDEAGEEVPFLYGKTALTLLIRKC